MDGGGWPGSVREEEEDMLGRRRRRVNATKGSFSSSELWSQPILFSLSKPLSVPGDCRGGDRHRCSRRRDLRSSSNSDCFFGFGCEGNGWIIAWRCSLGPSRCRVWFPAAALRRWRRRRQVIRSSRALPRLDGSSLRCRRRARGVHAFRRLVPTTLFVKDGEADLDLWQLGEWNGLGASRDGICRRRRVCIHGRWSSGCGPGRCVSSVVSILFERVSVFCGSCQSIAASMELDSVPSVVAADSGGGGFAFAQGPRTCLQFIYFLGTFL